MFKQVRSWLVGFVLASLWLCGPSVGLAQSRKIVPDLLRVQQTNGAPAQSPVRGLEADTRIQFSNGLVAIEAVVTAGENSTALLQQLQALGLRNGVAYRQMVGGYLPIDKINDLQNVGALRFARPVYEPIHNVGRVTSQGDRALRSDMARQVSSLSGAGSTVGVLSDTYNALGGAAAGVTSDDLPANVQVLDDLPTGSDEGRAMAEIVHDVAPGAAIAFHTAFRSQASFAQGIRSLAAAGCNIIVDDVIYFAEPFFQDGVIAQAVDDVTANGSVTYFSSATNNARSSYQSTFNSAGEQILPGYGVGTPHNFGGGDIYQRFTLPPNSTVRIGFQWDDPFASVSGGSGARTNMDFLVYFEGEYLGFLSSLTDNIGGDPFEFIGIRNTDPVPLDIDLVLVKKSGPDPNLVKWIFYGNGLTTSYEYDTRSSTVFGHPNSDRVVSVAAARYDRTPVFNANLTTAVAEGFTALGGTPILFTTTGERINGATGIVRRKPDITGPDGGDNTFFGGNDFDGTGFPNFFGTSASAPHVAAVGALMQQKSGNGLAPSSVLSLMQQNALDMDDPVTPGFDTGFDFLTGYGFLQADRAIAAVGQPLALVQPEYNCATGQITFQTTGGDGTPIEFRGIGITDWTTNPVQFIDAAVRADPNSTTVYLVARQSGREVTYTFNFRAYCQGSNGNQPPVLNTPIPTQFARQGQFFDFQFPTGTFSDPNNDALTYSIVGLPDGLVFDAANRRISGTPTQAGTFPIVITATDPGNGSARALFNIVVSPTGGAQPLALIAPLYDCSTGTITFRTVNGDGTPITFTAIGVQRNAETDVTGIVEAELRADPKPIVITATQSGVSVTFVFDLPGACGGGTPPAETFALIAPDYDCATGLFTFRVTNAAPGKTVEYYAAPGITDWTTNPTHPFNNDLRTAGDVKPFTLRARYVGEPGSEVTLEWVRPAPCSPGARLAARELETGLQVTVLGNPARDEQVEIDVTGAGGKVLQLRVSNDRGEWVSEQTVERSGVTQRQRISIGRSAGLYLLQVGTDTERKTVKIVRQ